MPAQTLEPDSGLFEHPAARFPPRRHARVRPYVFRRPAHVWCRGCGTSLAHPSAVTSILATSPMPVVGVSS